MKGGGQRGNVAGDFYDFDCSFKKVTCIDSISKPWYVKNVIGLSLLFSSTYSAKFHVSLNFISNISNPSWNPHQWKTCPFGGLKQTLIILWVFFILCNVCILYAFRMCMYVMCTTLCMFIPRIPRIVAFFPLWTLNLYMF